jgi:hypothetical protein
MRPFSSALHRMTWGRTSSHAVFWLTEEAIIAIQCWRAMLCLVRFREMEFTRSIESFAPDTPTLLAKFDTSLGGAGVVWFLRSKGAEEVVGVSAVDLRFLEFEVDSANQNLSVADEAVEMGVTGGVVLEVNGDESIMAILRLCDPRIELGLESEFIDFWIRARSAIDTFLGKHKFTNPVIAHQQL